MWAPAIITLCLAAVFAMGLNVERINQQDRSQEAEEIPAGPVSTVDDWSPTDALLLKYLLSKQWRLGRAQFATMDDFEQGQKKRSYWKQCAFNAVSCFG